MNMNKENIIGFNENDTEFISKFTPSIMFCFFEIINTRGVIYPFGKIPGRYNTLKISSSSDLSDLGNYNAETNEIKINSSIDKETFVPTLIHEFVHFLTKNNTRLYTYSAIDELMTEDMTSLLLWKFRLEREYTTGYLGIETDKKIMKLLKSKCDKKTLTQAYIDQSDYSFEKVLGKEFLEKLQEYFDYAENLPNKYNSIDIKDRLETDLIFEKEKLDAMFSELEKCCVPNNGVSKR